MTDWRQITTNDQVAVVVDHYDEDWQRLAWVQLRGRAAVITAGEDYDSATHRVAPAVREAAACYQPRREDTL